MYIFCFQIDECKLLSKLRASQSVGGGVDFYIQINMM